MSHTQPCIIVASQTSLYLYTKVSVMPLYASVATLLTYTVEYSDWIEVASCPRSFSAACLPIGTQRPNKLQSSGHVLREQSAPVKGTKHVHKPVERSHSPRLEHSAGMCPTSVATAWSDHALP